MVQNSHSNSLTFTCSGLFSSSVGFAKIFEIAQILLKCYLLQNGSRPILNKVALEINNSGKNGMVLTCLVLKSLLLELCRWFGLRNLKL